MAYNEELAFRVREKMQNLDGFSGRKMFGGIGFMLFGNMACGVIGEDLIVRVGPAGYESALDDPYTGEFDRNGRPMTGWVVVKPGGTVTDQQLEKWISRGVEFSLTLPAK